MRRKVHSIKFFGCLCIFLLIQIQSSAQHSVARQWNEVLLESIRNDFARPTVHARNLFHTSAAMYDAWAAYDPTASTYFLGQNIGGFPVPFEGVPMPADVEAAREEAISYAMYRILRHRFANSPAYPVTHESTGQLMFQLGYDVSNTSKDYTSGDPAALGNFIADVVISYGLQDGSNEEGEYKNLYYEPSNNPMPPELFGNRFMRYPNRWQPLAFVEFVGQSGISLADSPEFLSPEWGRVKPFAMTPDDRVIKSRDGYDYWVYNDPGDPCYIDIENQGGTTEDFKWGMSMVAMWSSHLDPADSVVWDISPGSIGNVDIEDYPTDLSGLRTFYDEINGGDIGEGHDLNPVTGQPYPPNVVKRGDYTRVLAEFWADGPDSETPPGHWFTILNYVNDHPDLVKKYKGEGETLNDLEWDIKSYFSLGGAMHDAAISAWSVKGYYDYTRPITAFRWMADRGQSSNPNLPNYDPNGLPLIPGFIELVTVSDTLYLYNPNNLSQIKVKAWRGPDYIWDPETQKAGVGWILASEWWPYQRPNFVTPPFAGYVSGHSTYSRAAAEVLTMFTGDAFFPGGVGKFYAKKNEFLVFEEGPSESIELQWATYRDASDQTSLSRIWGGIHPPVDDIPGRLIGEKVGKQSFAYADTYFNGEKENTETALFQESFVFPNPVGIDELMNISIDQPTTNALVELVSASGQLMYSEVYEIDLNYTFIQFRLGLYPQGLYFVRVTGDDWTRTQKVLIRE